MPPSGFNQKAINGLLMYVQSKYESLLSKRELSEKDEVSFLEETISELETEISTTGPEDTSAGLKIFIVKCYKDLVQEIYAGKDKYGRSVFPEKALHKEISQIKNYLTAFKL